MSEHTPKLEINEVAYNDYMATELGLDEVADPDHLDEDDRDVLENMVDAHQNGIIGLPDDPTIRAYVNGSILDSIGQSVEEPGYEEKNGADSETVEKSKRTLTPEQQEQLLSTLKSRFEGNMKRHKGIEWLQVATRLNEAAPEKLWSLNEMERTGGEPDVVGIVGETGEVEFWDCSKESPEGRRNVCYDVQGQEEAERHGYKPKGNAIDMAKEDMGLGGILNEEQIKKLGKLVKGLLSGSWSWVDTPEKRREKGVARRAVRDYDVVYAVGNDPDRHRGCGGFHGWLRV
jgi:hypothetical protein